MQVDLYIKTYLNIQRKNLSPKDETFFEKICTADFVSVLFEECLWQVKDWQDAIDSTQIGHWALNTQTYICMRLFSISRRHPSPKQELMQLT